MPIVWTFGFTLSSHKKYHYCPRLTTSLTGFGGKVNRQNEHHTLIIPHLTDEEEQYQLKCDPDSFYGFCTLYCAKFNYFLPDFLFTVKNGHKLHSYHLWELSGQTTGRVRGHSAGYIGQYQSDYSRYPAAWRGGGRDAVLKWVEVR